MSAKEKSKKVMEKKVLCIRIRVAEKGKSV